MPSPSKSTRSPSSNKSPSERGLQLDNAAPVTADDSFQVPGIRRASQQPVPLSYAYGAPPSPPRPGRRVRTGSMNGSNISASLGERQQDEYDESVDGFNDEVATGPSTFHGAPLEPAAVRYARLHQRKQATGSFKLPEHTNNTDDMDAQEGTSIHGDARKPNSKGSSVIQQSIRPPSSKDTSVNIATAFRQAVVAEAPVASTSTSIGFLGRAGDQNGRLPLRDSGLGQDTNDDRHDGTSASQHVPSSTAVAPPTSASKKRKKPSSTGPNTSNGAASSNNRSKNNSAYRPSKADLAEYSSDEFASDTEEIDLNELKYDLGWGPQRKAGIIGHAKVSETRKVKKPRKAGKKASRVSNESSNKENSTTAQDGAEGVTDAIDDEVEDSAASGHEMQGDEASQPSKGKQNSRRRAGDQDGAYQPGSGDEDDNSEGNASPNSKMRRRRAGRSTKHPDDHNVQREESVPPDNDNPAPEQNGGSVASYYLHEPSPDIEAVRAGLTQPGAGKLTQTVPKSNTYQPYFAFSTTMAPLTAGRQPLRARRDTSVASSSVVEASQADSPEFAGPSAIRASRFLPGDDTKTSSNASFDVRGSDYDYAEEERMAAALLAARERSRRGLAPPLKSIPEGRSMPDILSTTGAVASARRTFERGRERSHSSETSIDSTNHLQAHQYSAFQRNTLHNAPVIRRAPAPPDSRSGSVISVESAQRSREDHSDAEVQPNASNPTISTKSISRRLGELLRQILSLLYLCTVKPAAALIKADKNALLKWAGAILLLALVLASMYEHESPAASSRTDKTSWRTLFAPRKAPAFVPPAGTPSNLEELVARLTALESSFVSISAAQAADRAVVYDKTQIATDAAKRLSVLEAEFEGERRRTNRAHDAVVKTARQDADKFDHSLKGVKSQLDHVNDRLKSLAAEYKQYTVASARLADEVKKGREGTAHLNTRLADLENALHTATDEHRLVALAARAIEDLLPSRLAVAVDPKTGKVEISPAFWAQLRTAFADSDVQSGSKASGNLSWADFIAANSDQLRSFVSQDVEGRVNTGAIVSKAAFAKALQAELKAVQASIGQSTLKELSRMSSDLQGQISTVSAAVAVASNKPATVKLSSGEQLNDIVRDLIDAALDRYSKDMLARPDFALYSAGARVVPSLTSQTYEVRPASWSAALLARVTGGGVMRGLPPVTALHPDTAVGRCWAFPGQSGQLGILLSRSIYPTDITIEHASKDVALDVSSAPKRFEVWALIEDRAGLEQLWAQHPDNKPTNRFLLASGEYDVEAKSNVQTFPVDQAAREMAIPVNIVVVHILDNHGNQHLSCLYRIRVGGTIVQ